MEVLNLNPRSEGANPQTPEGTKLEDLFRTKFLHGVNLVKRSATLSGTHFGNRVFKIHLSTTQRLTIFKFSHDVRDDFPRKDVPDYRFDASLPEPTANPSSTSTSVVGVLHIQGIRLTKPYSTGFSAARAWKEECQLKHIRCEEFFIVLDEPGEKELFFISTSRSSAVQCWPYGYSTNIETKVANPVHGAPPHSLYTLANGMPFAPKTTDIVANLTPDVRKEIVERLEPLRSAFSSLSHVDSLKKTELRYNFYVQTDRVRRGIALVGEYTCRFVHDNTPALNSIAKDYSLSLLKTSAWWRQIALRYGCNYVLAVLVHFFYHCICYDDTIDPVRPKDLGQQCSEGHLPNRTRLDETLGKQSEAMAPGFLEYAEVIRELYIHANDQVSRATSTMNFAKQLPQSIKQMQTSSFESILVEQAKLKATLGVLQQLCEHNKWRTVFWPISTMLSPVEPNQALDRGFDVDVNNNAKSERVNYAQQSRFLFMILTEGESDLDPSDGNNLSPYLAPYPLHTVNHQPGYRLLDRENNVQYEWRSTRNVKTMAVKVQDRDWFEETTRDETQRDFDPRLVTVVPRDWYDIEELQLDDGSYTERYQKWAALLLAFAREARGTTLEATALQASSTPTPTDVPTPLSASPEDMGRIIENHATKNRPSATAQEHVVQGTSSNSAQPAVNQDIATSAAMLSADLADLTAIIIELRKLKITMPLADLKAQLASPLLPTKLLNDLFSNLAFKWSREAASSSLQSVLCKPKPEYGLLDDETAVQNMEVGIRVDLAGLTKYLMKIRDLDGISDEKRVSQQLRSMEIPRDLVARLLDNPELNDLWIDTTAGRGKKRKRTAEQDEGGQMEDGDATASIKEEPEGDM